MLRLDLSKHHQSEGSAPRREGLQRSRLPGESTSWIVRSQGEVVGESILSEHPVAADKKYCFHNLALTRWAPPTNAAAGR
jgi:hypothetical protein